MADPALTEFVKEALATGRSRAEIGAALSKAGWPPDQIDDALARFADLDFAIPVPRPRASGSAREAFLYIVYFSLLGAVAIGVGALAFAFIDAQFRDALGRAPRAGTMSGLRWQVSSLLVGFPIFIGLGWRLARARRTNAEQQTSRVRVWLTYVTLIFAALTLIGDLMAVVFQFLSGEMTARFLLKALTVAVISGAILLTYSRDAERTGGGVDMVGRVMAVLASLAAAFLVIWAFTLVRSPGAARAERFDDRRINDVGAIVRLVDCHRTYFGEIPDVLDGIEGRLAARTSGQPAITGCAAPLPRDPATDAAYVYRKGEGDGYELCADFQNGWPVGPDRERAERRTLSYGYGEHRKRRVVVLSETAGPHCFAFEAVDLNTEERSD